MNAMSPPIPLIPDNAPFSAAQRAWLNGFLAGLYGGAQQSTSAPAPEVEDFPWHDPALELGERMALAEGKPLKRRLMAAMAQLDCGQCGYVCQTYAEALAEGRETSAALCVPGEKPTQRMLKSLLAAAPVAAAAPPPVAKPTGEKVRVLAAERLTGAASAKDVRHVVIDLAGTALRYEPGDSIGLAAPNDPELVAQCLAGLRATGDEPVPCHDGETRSLREAFSAYLDIARPLDRTTQLMSMVAAHPGDAAALRRLTDGEDGAEPDKADLLDLLLAFPSARPPLADLARSLPALKPRLYSIASSLRATPGQVHLCVAVVRDTRHGRKRNGVASSFLADRAIAHGPILASITQSHFRLPRDPATPVIMIGPGTGIAPFRAFLEERAATNAPGKNWLFFGDQKAATDFLYREELEALQSAGILTRLDLAFSRDQKEKVYVQTRMESAATELFAWLEQGAYFYVCGDASRMAKDVEAALHKVVELAGGKTAAEAAAYIQALKAAKRYQRDVY